MNATFILGAHGDSGVHGANQRGEIRVIFFFWVHRPVSQVGCCARCHHYQMYRYRVFSLEISLIIYTLVTFCYQNIYNKF